MNLMLHIWGAQHKLNDLVMRFFVQCRQDFLDIVGVLPEDFDAWDAKEARWADHQLATNHQPPTLRISFYSSTTNL